MSAIASSRRSTHACALRVADGFSRLADARRAGAGRLRQAQGSIGAAGLRRPDRPHLRPAGRSGRRLGAVQAGRRPRPPAAGRGAGHRAGAMAHRARADRGVLRRRGARDAKRTVFAVGDRKQSIYSFQGADADEFDQSRDCCGRRVAASRPSLRRTRRSTCRSAPLGRCSNWWTMSSPIRLPRPAWSMRGDTLTHYADRADHAGAVELWPLAPLPDPAEPEPWAVPDQNRGLTSAPQRLADTLAEWIARETGGGAMLESRGRPLASGRRAGARPPTQRLRPCPGARAEDAAACRWPGWTGWC